MIREFLEKILYNVARADYTIQVGIPGTNIRKDDIVGKGDLGNFLEQAYQFGIWLAIILALGMVIYGGYLYLIAGAIPGTSSGKEKIKNAVIGLLIALGSVLILGALNPDLINPQLPGSLAGIEQGEPFNFIGLLPNGDRNVPDGLLCTSDNQCDVTRKCDNKDGKYKLEPSQGTSTANLKNPIFSLVEPFVRVVLAETKPTGRVYENKPSCEDKNLSLEKGKGTCTLVKTCRIVTDEELNELESGKDIFKDGREGKYYRRFNSECNPDPESKRGNCFDEDAACNSISGKCTYPGLGGNKCQINFSDGDCSSGKCDGGICVAAVVNTDKGFLEANHYKNTYDEFNEVVDVQAGSDERKIYKLVRPAYGWTPVKKSGNRLDSCQSLALSVPLLLKSSTKQQAYESCLSLGSPPLPPLINQASIQDVILKQIDEKEIKKYPIEYDRIPPGEGSGGWVIGYRALGYQHYTINNKGNFNNLSCSDSSSYNQPFYKKNSDTISDNFILDLKDKYDINRHDNNNVCVANYACCKMSDQDVCRQLGYKDTEKLDKCKPLYPNIDLNNISEPYACCSRKEQKTTKELVKENTQQCLDTGGKIIIDSNTAKDQCAEFCKDSISIATYDKKTACCTCPSIISP